MRYAAFPPPLTICKYYAGAAQPAVRLVPLLQWARQQQPKWPQNDQLDVIFRRISSEITFAGLPTRKAPPPRESLRIGRFPRYNRALAGTGPLVVY